MQVSSTAAPSCTGSQHFTCWRTESQWQTPLAQIQQRQVPTQQTVAPGALTVLIVKNLPSFRTGFSINRGTCAISDYNGIGLLALSSGRVTADSSCRRKRWGCKKVHLTLRPSGTKESILVRSGHPAFVCRLKMSIQKGPSQAPFCPPSLLRMAAHPSSRPGATNSLFLLACTKETPVRRHVGGKKRSRGW